ncbi:hypothetical protein [sulfur-oxidizing endosymbiont of Gigantopelta aegis]|uniref:hypothetical protein n=1 Tax=sulfur-oxidizing endosymbiont of Gigantopelta aegis TaxID=2794934 RepID=UPI0018DD6484|nr:hypothetical protein [sulfur-oxidizing endosymbiont of Gigantopelta aegis]
MLTHQFAQKDLIKFGINHCFLSKKDASQCYEQCIEALKSSVEELKLYIKKDENFASVGGRMVDSWSYSLKQVKHKELPVEIIRNWQTDTNA